MNPERWEPRERDVLIALSGLPYDAELAVRFLLTHNREYR